MKKEKEATAEKSRKYSRDFNGKKCFHCGDELTRDHNVFSGGHWFCGGVCAEIEDSYKDLAQQEA
jgi:hypothetical protein